MKHNPIIDPLLSIESNFISKIINSTEQKDTIDSIEFSKPNEKYTPGPDGPDSTAPYDPEIINTEENKENVADKSSGSPTPNLSLRQKNKLKRLLGDHNYQGSRDPAPNNEIENILKRS